MGAPDILSAEFEQNPYPYYEEIREKYPLFFHEPTNSYVISRYEDLQRAFRDPVFSSRHADAQFGAIYGRNMIQMDGREHATHRGLVTQALGSYKLREKYLPIIEENAREMIDQFLAAGEVELVQQFTNIFPISVITTIFGLPKKDIPVLQIWYERVVAFLSNLTQDPDIIATGLQTRKEFEAYLFPIIAQRRQNPGDDFLSSLCLAEIDGTKLTNEEIKAMSLLLLGAGTETTDKALSLMFRNLLQNNEQLEKIRQDRSLIDNALAETIRHSSPVQWLMRITDDDVEMNCGKIPANSTVLCLIGAANRDPKQFCNPDTFNILRPDLDVSKAFSGAANHLSFGAGKHFCVGAKLAKEEVRIATNLLLDGMQDLQLKQGEILEEEGFFTRGMKKLTIKFTPAGNQISGF